MVHKFPVYMNGASNKMFCKDCKYVKKDWVGYLCENPKVSGARKYDPVTGKLLPWQLSCKYARSSDNLCGKAGVHFEPNEIKSWFNFK